MVQTNIYRDFICQCLCNPNLAKYNHDSKTLHFLDWKRAAVDYFDWCSAKKGGKRNSNLNSMKEAFKKALTYNGKATMQSTAQTHTVGNCEKIFYIEKKATADILSQQINQGVETVTQQSETGNSMTGLSQLNTTEAENLSDQVPSNVVNCLTGATSTLTLTSGLPDYQSGSGNSLGADAFQQWNTTTEAETFTDQGANYCGYSIPTIFESAFTPNKVNANVSLLNTSMEKRNDYDIEQEWAVQEVENTPLFLDDSGQNISDIPNISEEHSKEVPSDGEKYQADATCTLMSTSGLPEYQSRSGMTNFSEHSQEVPSDEDKYRTGATCTEISTSGSLDNQSRSETLNPYRFECIPEKCSISGNTRFDLKCTDKSDNIQAGENLIVRFDVNGDVHLTSEGGRYLGGIGIIPESKRREADSIIGTVLSKDTGVMLGKFPFEYTMGLDELLDYLTPEGGSDRKRKKPLSKRDERTSSDSSSSTPSSDGVVGFRLLNTICYKAAARGAFHYFDALLTFTFGAQVLKFANDCSPDIETIARKNGHDNLADEIKTFMNNIEKDNSFDVHVVEVKLEDLKDAIIKARMEFEENCDDCDDDADEGHLNNNIASIIGKECKNGETENTSDTALVQKGEISTKQEAILQNKEETSVEEGIILQYLAEEIANPEDFLQTRTEISAKQESLLQDQEQTSVEQETILRNLTEEIAKPEAFLQTQAEISAKRETILQDQDQTSVEQEAILQNQEETSVEQGTILRNLAEEVAKPEAFLQTQTEIGAKQESMPQNKGETSAKQEAIILEYHEQRSVEQVTILRNLAERIEDYLQSEVETSAKQETTQTLGELSTKQEAILQNQETSVEQGTILQNLTEEIAKPEAFLPTRKETSTKQETIFQNQEEISVEQEAILQTNEETSAKQKAIVQGERGTSGKQNAILQNRQEIIAKQEAIQQNQEETSVEEETIQQNLEETSVKEETIQQNQEETTVKEKTVQQNQKETSVKQEAIQQNQEETSVEEETIQQNLEETSVKEETIQQNQEGTTVKEKTVQQNQKETSVKQETIQQNQKETSVKQETIQQNQEETSVKEETIQQNQEETSVEQEIIQQNQEETGVIEETIQQNQEEISVEQETIQQNQEETSVVEETIQQNQEETSVVEETIQQNQEETSVEQETIQQNQEETTVEQETIQQNQEETSVEEETIQQNQKETSVEQETIQQNQEETSVEQETIQQNQEETSVEEETIQQNQEETSVEQETIQQNQEETSVEQETIQQNQEETSVEEETIQQNQEETSVEQEAIQQNQEETIVTILRNQGEISAKQETILQNKETSVEEGTILRNLTEEIAKPEAFLPTQAETSTKQETTQQNQEETIVEQETIQQNKEETNVEQEIIQQNQEERSVEQETILQNQEETSIEQETIQQNQEETSVEEETIQQNQEETSVEQETIQQNQEETGVELETIQKNKEKTSFEQETIQQNQEETSVTVQQNQEETSVKQETIQQNQEETSVEQETIQRNLEQTSVEELEAILQDLVEVAKQEAFLQCQAEISAKQESMLQSQGQTSAKQKTILENQGETSGRLETIQTKRETSTKQETIHTPEKPSIKQKTIIQSERRTCEKQNSILQSQGETRVEEEAILPDLAEEVAKPEAILQTQAEIRAKRESMLQNQEITIAKQETTEQIRKQTSAKQKTIVQGERGTRAMLNVILQNQRETSAKQENILKKQEETTEQEAILQHQEETFVEPGNILQELDEIDAKPEDFFMTLKVLYLSLENTVNIRRLLERDILQNEEEKSVEQGTEVITKAEALLRPWTEKEKQAKQQCHRCELSELFLQGTRKWLLEKLDRWFTDEDSDSPVMIITGGPGCGKSVFAAKVCQMYEERGQLAACHFCKFNNADYRDPHKMLQSLAGQMCEKVKGFEKALTEQLQRDQSRATVTDAFRVLLKDPLNSLEDQEPMVVVIDALDESEVGGKSELLDLIADEFLELSTWIKVIITSRPDLPVQRSLSHLNPVEILLDDADNKEDLKSYQYCHCQLELRLKRTGQLRADDAFVDIVPRSIGVYYEKYEHLWQVWQESVMELERKSEDETNTAVQECAIRYVFDHLWALTYPYSPKSFSGSSAVGKARSEDPEDVVLKTLRVRENARLTEAAMDAENHGTKRNNRIPVLIVGRDRAARTSLKKCLMREQFDLQEPSTVGIEVDIVEVEEKDKAKPWQRTQYQQRMVSNAHVIDAISKDAANRARGSTKSNISETTQDPQPASGTNAPKTVNDCEKSNLTELGQQDKTKLLHDTQDPRFMQSTEDRNSSVPKREKEDRNRDSKESSDRNRLTREMLEAIKEEMKKVDQYDDDDKIRLLLHDVAGQSLFYDVHSIFLRLQSLFVLVVGLDEDLSAKAKPLFVNKKEKIKIEIENYLVETNLDYANRWMSALHCIRSLNKESKKSNYDQPATILVLTKPDMLTGSADDIERSIQTATDTLLNSFTKYQCRPHIVATRVVDNTKSDGGVTKLREVIFETCQESLKSQDKFPINWLRLERGLATVMTSAPYIEFKEVEQIGEESGVDVNLAEAVEVLHEQNVIVHFHDDEQARNLVVLDPQWLVNLFSRIITIPPTQTQSPKHAKLWERLKDHGELSTELLSILLGGHIKHKLALTSMMERVKLIYQWDEETWLVPSMAQATKATKCAQDMVKTCCIPPLYVYFEDSYVLLGLFTRLQVYFIRLSKSLGKGIPRISCDFSCIPLTHVEIEYSIILVQHVTRIQVSFTSGKAIPEHELLEVASEVKSLLQEGLNEIQRTNPVYRGANYHFAVKCDCGFAERTRCHRHQRDNCSDEGCVHYISIERLQKGENGCNRLMGGCDIKQFGPWLDIQVKTRDLICQKLNEETQEISAADVNSVVTDEQVFNAIQINCKVFEKKFEAKVEDKLRIIGGLIEKPRGGKATEVVDVAGPVTTVVACLACGFAVALGFTTLEVGSFAGAAVAATVLALNEYDKMRKKANAQVIQGISTEGVSSVLKCIVKEVGKELSRIFEYQLFMLKDERQLEILAHHAADLMFDLKDKEIFDRNTLLRKVLEGKKSKRRKLTTRYDKNNWFVQDVFRKAGLRKAVPTSNNLNFEVKFEYFVKPDDTACDVQTYGYRDQMLEMKCLTSCVEASATIEENTSCNACADCFSDSTCTNGTYFVASDVDADYTIKQLEPRSYQTLHCLVQCPKVLERFACSIKSTAPEKNERSLVNYVSEMHNLSLNPTLKPVYRPHSPSRVPDLTKANLRRCDFSHADFTGSKLNDCDFSECTIFFGTFEKAILNGSKFIETHISHCNFVSAQAQRCEWTKVKVLYSNVRGADFRNSKNPLGGNNWTGTVFSEAIIGDSAELPRKWEQHSESHKAKYQRLLEYGPKHPKKIKEINGVRVCCAKDFLVGNGCDGTCVYIGLAKDGCEKAVKRLLKDVCAHLGTQEKKILNTSNAINSKYVVQYWDYDNETDKEFGYLIEHLCEETLEQYVAKRTKEDLINKAPAIVRQILEVLNDLQCDPEPVLHMDLKPSNIMRNVSGNWLLVGFGISRTLAKGQTTHRAEQQGTKLWRAVESYPPKDESDSPEEDPGSKWVRYKKKSDIQVAGMIAFYILTKGKHPFGCEEERVLNLRDGNPVGLAKLPDPVGTVANDLISWMLQHKPEDRPSAKEALKHPYLQPADKQFDLLYCVGNEPEIKTTNTMSGLVSKLNNDPLLSFDWKAKINPDVMKYFCTDEIHKRVMNYGCEWTECLRLIQNTTQHWNDPPRPRPEAHSIVGNPQEYFLKLFPTLPVVIHRIIRSSERKETLQKFFT